MTAKEQSATAATEFGPGGPPGISSGYQPALDGLRAVAVGMVALFHLSAADGLGIVNGGWLGVDVFFVLSGYLITLLLLAEHQRQDRISLGNFYIRRFLRLAPLSIGLVAVLFLLTAIGVENTLGLRLPFSGGVAVLLYYANWWELARPGGLGSLAHAWSLSIEEQFYFVWPSIVIGVLAVARRSARRVLIGLALGGIIAIGLVRRTLWLAATVPGTPGMTTANAWLDFFRNSLLRGDALLFGCLLALLLHGRTVPPLLRRAVAVVAVLAMVVAVIILSATHFNLWQPWVPFIPAWGLSLFNLCISCVVAWLVISPQTPVARVLSLRPLTWVGRRAYGVYLLHPLVLDTIVTVTSWRRWPLEIASIAGTLVLAGLSFRYFETPFLRLKERYSSR